jgi:hypothetical protein
MKTVKYRMFEFEFDLVEEVVGAVVDYQLVHQFALV